ncbi:MAG: class I SAM-dependent methyltransferase, partial [Thermoplasmata archaeon]
SVRGRSLLHLQCHFGMDTLAWARRGARVTGVDYSTAAIAAARTLAHEVGVDARFVESNVYDARRRLRERFDLVYTGKGAMMWLPELPIWAERVAGFLNPGGRFYLIEDHPISDLFRPARGGKRLVLDQDYFRHRPLRFDGGGTYAARRAKMRNTVSFEWVHPVSDVINALIGAGLRIESVTEYPFTYWAKFPRMREDREGSWHLREREGSIPLMFSLRARKP